MCEDFYQGSNAVKGVHWWIGEEEGNENGLDEAKKACDKDFECHGFVKNCDYGNYFLCKGKISDSLKRFDSNPCARHLKKIGSTYQAADLTLYRKGQYIKTNH